MTEAASTQDSQHTNPPQQTEQQTQQQPPSQPSQQPAANNGPGPGTQILAELQALPERITNAIKEAMVPPRAPASQQSQQGQQNPASNAQSATAANSPQNSGSVKNSAGSEKPQEPGKKTFAEWWFKG